MKQRVITGFVFAFAILLFFIPGYFNPFALSILWAAVALICAREMILCVQAKGLRPSHYLSYFGACLSMLPVIVRVFSNSALLALGIYCLTVLMLAMNTVIFLVLIQPGEHAFADGIATSGVLLYVSFPLACANITGLFIPNGWYFVAIGVIAPWVSDVFAYFTGSLIGKHKIVPHISPKKTWEGCIGGAVGSAAIMILFFWLFLDTRIQTDLSRPVFYLMAGVSGLILSAVSQVGDWMASAIKRWAGIKDFGKILPGHGGLLDRFDSAFFTLPMALLLAFYFAHG
jgi:phosphatidate cytidylyltransferase